MQLGQTLKVISLCSYLTETENGWRKVDYTASNMVKALKGIDFNGYFIREYGGIKHRFDRTNAHKFAARIPGVMCNVLKAKYSSEALIVPIPNSHVISADTPAFKTLQLAQDICDHSDGQFTVLPLLTFDEVQAKTRTGGTRNISLIMSRYVLSTCADRPVILLDDVVTTGAHLIAAYRKLTQQGARVDLALVFGSSTKVSRAKPISVHEQEFAT